jgi:hypothetical protein
VRLAQSKQLTPLRSLQLGTKAGTDGFAQVSVFGEVVLDADFGEP